MDEKIYYYAISMGGDVNRFEWWQRDRSPSTVQTSSADDFRYDVFGRLSEARYIGASADGTDLDSRDFSSRYQYDLHGNVTALRRNGITGRISEGGSEMMLYGEIDDVTLTYSGNRLVCADDGAEALVYDGAMDFTDGADDAEEYAYDANGNMPTDLNKGIERATYDHNNLPNEILLKSRKSCRYTYDSSGRKLRAEYRTPRNMILKASSADDEARVGGVGRYVVTTIEYCGDNVYRNGALLRTHLPNGYIENDSMYFYVNDCQSNVRCVVRQDGAVVESNEYYPYGGLFCAAPSVQPYKYGAKELDRMHGIDLYDSEARWYDPVLGRTTTMDPLAEKYPGLSPYAWCAANPLRFSDPTGMDWIRNEITNEYKWMDDVTSSKLTPKGYEYIGNNTELLKSLNINPNTQVQNGSKFNFGPSVDSGMGIFIGTKSQYEAFYSAQVEVGQSDGCKNSNNVNGFFFSGISFTAVFNQLSLSPNTDYITDYKGSFSVVYGNNVFASIFKNYNDSSIIMIHQL